MSQHDPRPEALGQQQLDPNSLELSGLGQDLLFLLVSGDLIFENLHTFYTAFLKSDFKSGHYFS